MEQLCKECRVHLSRTHEVRKALSTFWYDILDNLPQVSCDEIDIVGRVQLVWIAVDGPGMRLRQ